MQQSIDTIDHMKYDVYDELGIYNGVFISVRWYHHYNSHEMPFVAVDNVVAASDVYPSKKGLLAYEKLAVLNGTEVHEDNFIERVFYYDYMGRIIQTVEKNHLGGISRYSTKYDFVGNILASIEQHYDINEEIISELELTARDVANEVLVTPDEGEPLVEGEYFFIGSSDPYNYRKIQDPENRYFISTAKVHEKYLICTNEGTCYYYIPEDCLEIVNTTLNLSGSRANYGFVEDFPGEGEPLTEIVDPPYYETVYETVYDSTYVNKTVQRLVELDSKRTEFTYDHRSRLLSETTILNDGDPATVFYAYDELGKLVGKTYGRGVDAISETYDYNIRDWLTSKTSDVFDMNLRYYDPQKGTTPSYTGNITEWEWQHHDAGNAHNTYAFTYDKLSRLTDSELYENGHLANTFVENGISYDKNGNLLKMKRHQGDASIADEEMEFTVYNGNQLMTMQNNGIAYGYEYDANGNMTSDEYNALKLKYNYLNLTAVACDMSNNVQATYSWLADGRKLGVRNAAGTSGYEYLGSLVYKYVGSELQLESTGFGGGRIMVSESTNGNVYIPNYYITDHLGSTRAIYDGSENIVRSNFLPYGTRWNDGQAASSRYQFTGYEDQEFLDRKYMDAGARLYNGIIFNRVDPVAEIDCRISPYAYCRNNPINAFDPDGRFTLDANQAKKYPRLTHYLSKIIHEIADNPRIMSGLMKYGKLSELQIREHLTWGKGPQVRVFDVSLRGHNPQKVYGFFNPSFNQNSIQIGENWVQLLEEATGMDREILLFIIGVTILHEYVHYGEYLVNGICDENDAGNSFEKAVYGRMIFYGDDSAHTMLERWMQQQDSRERKAKADSTRSLLRDAANGDLKEGTYTWNGYRWAIQ